MTESMKRRDGASTPKHDSLQNSEFVASLKFEINQKNHEIDTLHKKVAELQLKMST